MPYFGFLYAGKKMIFNMQTILQTIWRTTDSAMIPHDAEEGEAYDFKTAVE